MPTTTLNEFSNITNSNTTNSNNNATSGNAPDITSHKIADESNQMITEESTEQSKTASAAADSLDLEHSAMRDKKTSRYLDNPLAEAAKEISTRVGSGAGSLAATSTSITTIIKQSPTSPVPLDVQHPLHVLRNTRGRTADETLMYSDAENLELSPAQQQNRHQHQQHHNVVTQHQQQHQHSSHHLHHPYQHPSHEHTHSSTASRLNPNSTTNSATAMEQCQLSGLLTSTAATNSAAIEDDEHEHLAKLSLERPPPPSYHATSSHKQHPPAYSTSIASATTIDTSGSEILTSGANQTQYQHPNHHASSSARLTAYEQFLKLSAQEYSASSSENAALNLSSAAAAMAAAAAVANATAGTAGSSLALSTDLSSQSNLHHSHHLCER